MYAAYLRLAWLMLFGRSLRRRNIYYCNDSPVNFCCRYHLLTRFVVTSVILLKAFTIRSLIRIQDVKRFLQAVYPIIFN